MVTSPLLSPQVASTPEPVTIGPGVSFTITVAVSVHPSLSVTVTV